MNEWFDISDISGSHDYGLFKVIAVGRRAGKLIVHKAMKIFNTNEVTAEQLQFAAHQMEFTQAYYNIQNKLRLAARYSNNEN